MAYRSKAKAKRSKTKQQTKVQVTPTYLESGSVQIGLHDVIKALQMIEKHGHLDKLGNGARRRQLYLLAPAETVNFVKDFIVKHDMYDQPIGKHIVNGNGRPLRSKVSEASRTITAASRPAKDPHQCNFGRAG
jgi:hypothetical protein